MEDPKDLGPPQYCCECGVIDKCEVKDGEKCEWYGVTKEE